MGFITNYIERAIASQQENRIAYWLRIEASANAIAPEVAEEIHRLKDCTSQELLVILQLFALNVRQELARLGLAELKTETYGKGINAITHTRIAKVSQDLPNVINMLECEANCCSS